MDAALAVAIAVAALEAVGLVLLWRQNSILRRQVETEERAQDSARAADVHVVRGGRDGLGYSFELTNVGPATATRVQGWLASPDHPEQPVSSVVQVQRPLLAGARSERLRVTLTEAQVRERPPLVLALSWRDSQDRQGVAEHEVRL